MTTYEHVRHADLEWQRQMRAVEVARRAPIDATARAEAAWKAFADATEAERLAYLASVRQPVELGDEANASKLIVD
ncbi:MAG: hypothetical protein EBT09_10030 [Actinobacteria bacterium]|jgi:hypothetical protein|nr:hypothetical protein [Actinomycetota bacterium]